MSLRAIGNYAAVVILTVATGVMHGCGDGGTDPNTPAGSFTLSAAATVRVLQGGEGEGTIDLARADGFTGMVGLKTTGVPVGLTATIDPGGTAGTKAFLVVRAAPTMAAGNATVTIVATSGRIEQTRTVTVAVAPSIGGTGNVRVDFSACSFNSRPIWFAFQDGTGAWTQIIGSAGDYRFNVASAKGGYAYINAAGNDVKWVTVSLATQAELTASTISHCGPSGPKTVSGTLGGLAANDVVYLGMGGPNPNPEEGGPVGSPFTLTGLQDGNLDLIAYRSSPLGFGTSERVIIRRDQNIPNNGTLGNIDFNSVESFAPATAALTVTEAGSGSARHSMSYLAGAGCSFFDLYESAMPSPSGADLIMRGIPAAQQRPSDFHHLWVHKAPATTGWSILVRESFHTLTNRVIALPADLPAPTITAPPGGHKRIQAALTLPSEYNGSMGLQFGATGGAKGAGFVAASFGWLGGATATLTLPDFSVVTGWRSSFLPASDASYRWYLAASGANGAGTGGWCVENARFVTAYMSGAGPI